MISLSQNGCYRAAWGQQSLESGQSYAVYRFVISVNPMDITELNATLGNYILHEPVRAAAIFQTVCDASVRTLSLIGEYRSEAQINVILKVTHLPDLPGYHLSLSEFPLDYTSQRLYMMEGTVTALSTVNKYTQGARFLCSDTNCPLSKDFRYIRIHTPGATESATVRQDFFCDLCTSPLKEDMKYRVLGDKQVIEFMDSKALGIFQGQCAQKDRLQSYAVFLRDELIDRMKIGGRYRVIGIPVCDLNGSQVTVCIEANNIHQYIARTPPTMCKAFQKLYSKTLNSPWMFTGVLANIFAAQVVPIGIYSTLKLYILLSLVQTCNEDKEIGNPLDLMVVTNDTLIVERLMRYSICLVPRGVCHTHFNDILATVTKDELGTGAAMIHAGSALMAKGGVCFIGDINSHKKEKIDLLLSVLENRNTTVFIPGKKYGDGVDQQISIPVQCNFWSYADLSNYSKKCNTKECTLIGRIDLGAIPSHLTDAFGAIINCSQISHTYPVVTIVHHSLIKAIRPGTFLCPAAQQFTTQEFEELIGYAKNLHVTFSAEAETLLHSYYLASRRVRTDPNGSKVLTSALRHLTSMAEAHAKLCLRQVVTEDDALVAVLLFEASLTLKHGSSVFGVGQNPLFPCDIIDENSFQQRDKYLRIHQEQLRQFIFTYSPALVTMAEQ
ncbi:minichromosome maintenance domain-containing protein 2 isoform X2 [Dendropsophus ebraccatus]|uniref:minichromosome maintenance domain-containing protein 2 isoform X2 n=1 Tax=Dendropsophus ebraccatus TaxID=150705 RepID=UPI003831FBBB